MTSPADDPMVARLARLRRCLGRLRPLAARPPEEFLNDQDAIDIAERNLQVAIQACVDLGAAWLAREGEVAPQSYREIFTALARRAHIAPELAVALEQAAGLRNILVHEYVGVDARLLHRHLGRIEALETFGRAVLLQLDHDS